MVQTAHAVANFAAHHPDEFKAWQHGSNYLCCLSSSLDRIMKTIYYLDLYDIKYTIFREPDIGDEITAISVESLPNELHRKLFKNFKLGLS
jgi:hypothetical protein